MIIESDEARETGTRALVRVSLQWCRGTAGCVCETCTNHESVECLVVVARYLLVSARKASELCI